MRRGESAETMEIMKNGAMSIFHKIGHYNEAFGQQLMAHGVTGVNMTALLGIIEQRIGELVDIHNIATNAPISPLKPESMDHAHISSGDSRAVIEAASAYPAIQMVIGIEIDAALVALSRRKIQEQNLQQRAAIIHEDWLSVATGYVDVVFLFFLPQEDIARLLQQKLRSGTRVITCVFQIQQWTPKQIAFTVPFMTDHGRSFIYLYDLPETIRASSLPNELNEDWMK